MVYILDQCFVAVYVKCKSKKSIDFRHRHVVAFFGRFIRSYCHVVVRIGKVYNRYTVLARFQADKVLDNELGIATCRAFCEYKVLTVVPFRL